MYSACAVNALSTNALVTGRVALVHFFKDMAEVETTRAFNDKGDKHVLFFVIMS